MRSDRDNRTDTEKEIDAFLSKFDTPADKMSNNIDSYLDDAADSGKTFSWKKIESSDEKKASGRTNKRTSKDKDASSADKKHSDEKRSSSKSSKGSKTKKVSEKKSGTKQPSKRKPK